MVFLALLAIPVLVALAFLLFGAKKVTLDEFLVQMAVQIVFAGACVGITHCSNTSDTEVWNGRVVNKKQEWVSCSHSYSCNCRQVCSSSGKTQSCSTHCDTCYEHSNDWDWAVYTTNSERIEISRVDRRGSHEPPRFSATRIGEPTARTHDYTNYIKAAPDTLFRHQGLVEKYKDQLLPYPQGIYDYWHLQRLVVLGSIKVNGDQWEADLMELNADLGAAKQVNVIVALVERMPGDYAQALDQHWLGGKKNDVVVLMSATPAGAIEWAHVMAWTDAEMFKVKLRDDLVAVGSLDRGAVMQAIRKNVGALYVRKPMKDFEYLEASITPTTTQWVVCITLGILLSVGLGVFMVYNDIEFLPRKTRRRY